MVHNYAVFYRQGAPAPRQFPTRIELPKFTSILLLTNKECFWRILACWIRLRAQILQITVRYWQKLTFYELSQKCQASSAIAVYIILYYAPSFVRALRHRILVRNREEMFTIETWFRHLPLRSTSSIMQMAGNIHDQLRKFAVIMQYPRHICKQANYGYYGRHVSALSAVAMHYRLHYAS